MQEDISQIIIRVKNGDQAAFKWLVENYQQPAFSLAFRIICNEDDACDIVQESFIKIWSKIDSFRKGSNFISWLFKIVANTAIDKLRLKKRNNSVSIDLHPENLKNSNFQDWEKEIDNKELGNLIKTLANGLPEKQRLIFILRDIQGLSSKESGEILDLTDSVIKSNLYHARIAIRNKLIKTQEKERSNYEL